MLVSPPNVWIKTSIQDHLYNQWILSLSLSDLKNDFEHFKQMYGFSPARVLKCIFNLDDRANNFEHMGHEGGF
jgi:hypothetical protein